MSDGTVIIRSWEEACLLSKDSVKCSKTKFITFEISSRFGPEQSKSLTTIIRNGAVIKKLGLGGSEMCGESLFLLSLALRGVRSLEILELGGNSITDSDVGTLVDILDGLQASLLTLNLRFNGIGDAGLVSLAPALRRMKRLEELNLSSNLFGSGGIKALASSFLEDFPLRRLYLFGIKFDAVSLENMLFRGLLAGNLRVIDLWHCGVGPVGAHVLADIISKQICPLEELYVGNAGFGDAGCSIIFRMMVENSTIRVLDVSSNGAGTDSLKDLLNVIQLNGVVSKLLLQENSFRFDACRLIVRALKQRGKGFLHLDLQGNPLQQVEWDALNRLGSESLHYTLVGGQGMADHYPMIHESEEDEGFKIPDLSLKIPKIKMEELKSEYASVGVKVEKALQDEAEMPRHAASKYYDDDDSSHELMYSLQSEDRMNHSFTYFDEDDESHGLSWISAKKKTSTRSRWKEYDASHQERYGQEVHRDGNGIRYIRDDKTFIDDDEDGDDIGSLGVDDDFDKLETNVMQHYDLCHVAPQPRLSPRSRMREWEAEKGAMKAQTPESGEEWANESDTDVEESKHETYLSCEHEIEEMDSERHGPSESRGDYDSESDEQESGCMVERDRVSGKDQSLLRKKGDWSDEGLTEIDESGQGKDSEDEIEYDDDGNDVSEGMVVEQEDARETLGHGDAIGKEGEMREKMEEETSKASEDVEGTEENEETGFLIRFEDPVMSESTGKGSSSEPIEHHDDASDADPNLLVTLPSDLDESKESHYIGFGMEYPDETRPAIRVDKAETMQSSKVPVAPPHDDENGFYLSLPDAGPGTPRSGRVLRFMDISQLDEVGGEADGEGDSEERQREKEADIEQLLGERSTYASLASEEANHYALFEMEASEPHIHFPKYTTTAPLPSDFPQQIEIRVQYSSDVTVMMDFLQVGVGTPVRDLMHELFEGSLSDDRHILKASGSKEFLYGHESIGSYTFVRSKLKKGKTIVFTILDMDTAIHMVRDHRPVFKPHVPKYEIEGPQISAYDFHHRMRLLIRGVKRLNPDLGNIQRLSGKNDRMIALDSSGMSMCVTAGVFHGGKSICPVEVTKFVPASTDPSWNEWKEFDVNIADIPDNSRMCLTVWVVKKNREKSFFKIVSQSTGDLIKGKENPHLGPLGWVNVQLIDFKGVLVSGHQNMRLWGDGGAANPIGTCVEASQKSGVGTLSIQFESFDESIVFPQMPPPSIPTAVLRGHEPSLAEKKKIERTVKRDPLYELTVDEKKLLWENRGYCALNVPDALPKFLEAVRHTDRRHVMESRGLLSHWTPPSPLSAIQLLDAMYGDRSAREFAIKCLDQLSDSELVDILLQLCQVLKYEPYHDSELARFLVRRALMNPQYVGHYLFWHLKAEMHVTYIRERYGLILREYLTYADRTQRKHLLYQDQVLKILAMVAAEMKDTPKALRKEKLHARLRDLQDSFPKRYTLPLDARMEVSGLVIEKCRTMDSKKVPLWLVFENADPGGDPIYVMFKSGDDLRQDLLTLQLIRIMDNLWQMEGLDLRLNPYGCVATGDEEGMLEIVLNSDTTANITKTIGGGAKAAFRKDTLQIWLRQHNPSDEEYAKAVDNFVPSCAGYCVAMYVLGIGDRHNDNVMVTRSGQLFHIDFGHFLGNIKRKFGVRRERAPFVFTPDFAEVMGGPKGEKYAQFVEIAGRAYNIIRHHADLFINLFRLMLSTGIPELRKKEDIEYLRNALSLEMSDKQAAKHFAGLIRKSLNSKATLINNMVHILAH